MTRTASTLLFLKKDDSLLLAMKKRGFGKGKYNGVGGKIEKNETIEQAVARECQEEIGVTPTVYQKVAENDFSWPDEDGKITGFFTHVYICTKWKGEPCETEEMAPLWFNQNNIPYKKMWQDDPFWLPEVLSGKKIKGVFTFDKNFIMVTHDVKVVQSFIKEKIV